MEDVLGHHVPRVLWVEDPLKFHTFFIHTLTPDVSV